MLKCHSCDKPVSKVRLGSGNYRKFCNQKCYIKWAMKNKGVRQLVAERNKDHKAINEAIAKAREGDTAAQAFLRRFHGVRGLWNAKTKRIERF